MMSNLVYGVGYHQGVNRKAISAYISNNRSEYDLWVKMLRRCYDSKFHDKYPTYKDCTVAKEWHDFQNFAEWCKKDKYHNLGYALDKDILSLGGKLYSPETCCFVPVEINNLFNNRKVARGNYPIGVSVNKADKRKNMFRANISINGRLKNLGYFSTADEAYKAYCIAKIAYVKEVALKWEGCISKKVFNKLMTWSRS